ncbi:Increased rDNA silencing protein 4 [Pseudocercospora fuligena]|uniref:Increased rDNA silencing protein 4 n=1 Tax=Pseudocercospora fuligena TaxID=685502 RepID=A0A8H6VIV1_9PEZI|nr:Increased rDNA silencing protein 4 [Pseudocercospora fuligena]
MGYKPPSRASSIASVDTTTSTASSQQNAALLGANLAFGRPPPRERAPTQTYVGGSNGALSAANTANIRGPTPNPSDIRSRGRSPLPARAPVTGSAAGNTASNITKEKMPNLSLPQQERPRMHNRSPSQQAAVLAAARAKPSSAISTQENSARPRTAAVQRPAIAPKPRRLSEHFRSNESADLNDTADRPTDSTPIAPTGSLVNLFEQRLKAVNDASPAKRPEPVIINPSRELSLKSPKPVRSGGITSMFQLELEEAKRNNEIRPEPLKQNRRDSVPGRHDGNSSDDSFASASEDLNIDKTPPSLPRSTTRAWSPSPSQSLRAGLDEKRRPLQPSPSPVRQTASRPMPIQQPQRPSSAASDAMSVTSAPSLRSIPAQFNQAHPRRMTPLRTGDDLANALVASSLASSRAPSPTRLEPPPVPTRRKRGHSHKLPFSRTPSPAKVGMLHTLRNYDGASSSESEDEKHPYRKHQKKRLIRKHPNKHHEGERKRWRDAITERERKRYEGVWAANKGLYYSFTYEEQTLLRQKPDHPQVQELQTAVNDQVSNIVARDIWSRSRLPEPTLEMVWDLVDNDSVGRLQKEEFVVGMWLIDQRLKGRKLPVKVTESVWASVRSIGIKVRKKA